MNETKKEPKCFYFYLIGNNSKIPCLDHMAILHTIYWGYIEKQSGLEKRMETVTSFSSNASYSLILLIHKLPENFIIKIKYFLKHLHGCIIMPKAADTIQVNSTMVKIHFNWFNLKGSLSKGFLNG